MNTRRRRPPVRRWVVIKTYRALSTAPVERIWWKLANLGDLSWHPLMARADVPWGLLAKPGILFEAVSRLSPLRMRLFVERVDQGEFLSFRVFALPGIEEQVSYQVHSTVLGTQITYSVTLRGWLAPLVWSLIRPHAERVAQRLAQAAEQEAQRIQPI
ncbi:MAG: SRPBCC family protein [Gloeomargaritaceae cyanobacterium C42_A2020_066]|nr:SRPBCC family protein [Gloeomargaritaceae cyanobacterium C42_A2020_066]